MLVIHTALLCEATPIISKYKLKKLVEINAFQVYRNDRISLIVSGLGKVAAASAVGFLQGWSQASDQMAWLNIGISGHSDLNVGTGFLANKIIDRTSKQSWFPPFIFNSDVTTDQLHTVDLPDGDYREKGGVDMEASAFYATASRFSTGELVQSYKVVSDNPNAPVKKMSKNEASDLINSRINEIGFFVDSLIETSHELTNFSAKPDLLTIIKNKIKLTHSEQLQIRDRLSKAQLLSPNSTIDLSSEIKSGSAKNVIIALDQFIDTQPIRY